MDASARSILCLFLSAFVFAAPGVKADVLEMYNGSLLQDVEVLRENWREVTVRFTENIDFRFKRDEVKSVSVTESASEASPGGLVIYYGLEVTKEMSRQLAQTVSVDYAESHFYEEVIRQVFLDRSKPVPVILSDGVKEKIDSGDLNPIWSIRDENIRLVDILRQLAEDKNLKLESTGQGTAIEIALPEE